MSMTRTDINNPVPYLTSVVISLIPVKMRYLDLMRRQGTFLFDTSSLLKVDKIENVPFVSLLVVLSCRNNTVFWIIHKQDFKYVTCPLNDSDF